MQQGDQEDERLLVPPVVFWATPLSLSLIEITPPL
jgi:hypothetical protein